MVESLKGKKLLIVGGSFQHCQLVEAAHKFGIVTYVVDYLPFEESPAKQISDYHSEHNIFDFDKIVDLCKKESIDGVLSTHLDACQLPYYQICERLNYPCYGTKEQFQTFTDKTAFKKFLLDNDLDTIPQYDEDIFFDKENCLNIVEFPIFIKPCISCNSKGQSICRTYEEALNAIEIAKKASMNGRVVIEKYMENVDDFAITLLVLNGKVYIERIGDRYLGYKEDKLDRFGVYCPWPSKNRKLFLDKVFPKLEKAILTYGINNAPIFIQGFVDGDVIRFYDPGLRFPGFEFERVFKRLFNINVVDIFIKFALLGSIDKDVIIPDKSYELRNHRGSYLYFMIKPGTIGKIQGVDEIKSHKNVVCYYQRYSVGSEVKPTYNSKQSFAEITLLTSDINKMKETLNYIYENLIITDLEGNNMVISKVDTSSFC